MPRLNDTAALVALPSDGATEHTVSVKKIDNGYLTRTSSYNYETGECRSNEQFSTEKPRINPPGVSRDAAGSNSLSDTKRYLDGK